MTTHEKHISEIKKRREYHGEAVVKAVFIPVPVSAAVQLTPEQQEEAEKDAKVIKEIRKKVRTGGLLDSIKRAKRVQVRRVAESEEVQEDWKNYKAKDIKKEDDIRAKINALPEGEMIYTDETENLEFQLVSKLRKESPQEMLRRIKERKEARRKASEVKQYNIYGDVWAHMADADGEDGSDNRSQGSNW